MDDASSEASGGFHEDAKRDPYERILETVRRVAELAGAGPAATSQVSPAATTSRTVALHAAALAAQDAADYQRNILALSAAVQGKAMALLLDGRTDPANATGAFSLAAAAALLAPISASLAAAAIAEVTEKFPTT